DPSGRLPAPWDPDAIADPCYLYPADHLAVRRQEDFPEVRREDLRDDILAFVEKAARCGLETLLVDLTRPDAGLHAVKVVVPGLRHIWPRFGPGRLYEVPVRLGWREGPLGEDELNPVPLFL